MTQTNKGKTSFFLLLALAAAALAMGYALFFHQPGDSTPREVTALTTPPKDVREITPRIRQPLTEDQLKQAQAATAVREFVNPLESSGRSRDLEEILAGLDFKALQELAESETPVKPPEPASQPAAEETRPKPDLAKPEEPTGEGEEEKPAPEEPGRSVWAVNAISTMDSDKAERVLSALRQTPYQIYSYHKEVDGKNWLRIRVGFFKSREEAETVGRRLAKEHGLPPPWIVRPGPQELAEFYQKNP